MWILGGIADINSNNDVWRSSNGSTWELMSDGGVLYSPRHRHAAVSYGGYMWVMGGTEIEWPSKNEGKKNVWLSRDGVNWLSRGESEAFGASGRDGLKSFVHEDEMWFIGGGDLNDIWRSINGEDWMTVTVPGNRFERRSDHEAIVLEPSFVPIDMIKIDGEQEIFVNENAAVGLGIYTLSPVDGRLAPYSYNVISSGDGIVLVNRDGVIILVSSTTGSTVTAVFEVRDRTLDNIEQVSLVLKFSTPINTDSQIVTQSVMAGSTGTVYASESHITGGSGSYAYTFSNISPSINSVEINVSNGDISLSSGLNSGDEITLTLEVLDILHGDSTMLTVVLSSP